MANRRLRASLLLLLLTIRYSLFAATCFFPSATDPQHKRHPQHGCKSEPSERILQMLVAEQRTEWAGARQSAGRLRRFDRDVKRRDLAEASPALGIRDGEMVA